MNTDSKEINGRAGKGGVKCYCCDGRTCGKKNKKLGRAVRRCGKQRLRKDLHV